MTKEELDALIEERFADLAPKLKLAARFVLDAPKDVALKSMRAVASQAGLQPTSMLRLARVLGFESFDDFKAVYVEWLASQDDGLVSRTLQLRRRTAQGGAAPLLGNFAHTELTNLDRTLNIDNEHAWEKAQQALGKAARIYVVGLRSLFSCAFYFHYVLSSFRSGVELVHGTGGTIVDELRYIGKNDALLCFTASPYSVISVQAATLAKERGATLIAISDSNVSPVAAQANVILLAPNNNVSVFPSVVPHMAVAHTLAQLMASAEGDTTLEQLSHSEGLLRRFGVYTGKP